MDILSNKQILLGISGGVAAYKACDIASRLVKAGARVRVLMTRHATRLIRPILLEAITSSPVVYDLFGSRRYSAMDHIWAASKADGVIIAPATANVIAKLALGLADDALSTAVLCSSCPTVFAPAMNATMWRQPVTQDNAEALRRRGWLQVGPEKGRLACGIEDIGRMAPPETIVAELVNALAKSGSMSGLRVLVSAGPTHEHLDDFRVLTNPSTGRMGYAIAAAAYRRGANVTLVTGPTALEPPAVNQIERVTSAQEMQEALNRRFEDSDILIMAAAVADFSPEQNVTGKSHKNQIDTILKLKSNPDILAELSAHKGKRFLVGFAADVETELEQQAQRKLKEKNLDLIIANPIGTAETGFASENNQGWMLSPTDSWRIDRMSKIEMAEVILDKVTELYVR